MSEGQIIIKPGVNVWPHEMKTAQTLSGSGLTIEFIPKSNEPYMHTADVLIDGVPWEMKAPKGSSIKTVERNLRKAIRQSDHIVFDSRRLKSIPDAAVERELRACCEKRVKGIARLLPVNRHGEAVEIK